MYMHSYSNTINQFSWAKDLTFPVLSTLLNKIKKLGIGWDIFTEAKTRFTDNARGQSANALPTSIGTCKRIF